MAIGGALRPSEKTTFGQSRSPSVALCAFRWARTFHIPQKCGKNRNRDMGPAGSARHPESDSSSRHFPSLISSMAGALRRVFWTGPSESFSPHSGSGEGPVSHGPLSPILRLGLCHEAILVRVNLSRTRIRVTLAGSDGDSERLKALLGPSSPRPGPGGVGIWKDFCRTRPSRAGRV
jgi:hypothetical protein